MGGPLREVRAAHRGERILALYTTLKAPFRVGLFLPHAARVPVSCLQLRRPREVCVGAKMAYMVDASEKFETTGLTSDDVSNQLEVRADNREEAAVGIKSSVAAALDEMGLVGDGYAKRAYPGDTGRLRNSMAHPIMTGEKSVHNRTNLGLPVEHGRRAP